MPEDWNAIAAEVDAALKSVADVSQTGGYPATLQMPPSGGPANPWDPPAGSPTYATVFVVEGVREIRDAAGTTVLQTQRTLLVSAIGAVPAKGQQIAVGVAEADVIESTVWNEIAEVRPVSPAGTVVLYEVALVV
ncbi:hypothetical protein [Devosia sp. Root105]|uniref:hypothetical protein n=1 Tax=Devosia sp. Root105 TaxID=1736423 RepID=UPI000700A072|nr:hypothetical protein [Devosia sp. Root105]KQU96442.1 hypothetical protein ASC68_13775 [Devosia sp. Root105]